MEIWLKGDKRFRIPVLPSEYSVRSERGDETVIINSLGEVDLGGKRKLKSISFSSFFPAEGGSFVDYDCPSPRECVEIMEKIQHGSPCKLTITGTPIRMYCRISSFTWEEHDGSCDIYYSLTLTEHRNIEIGKSSVAVDSDITNLSIVQAVQDARPDPPKNTVEYTVQAGESYSSIARKTTGKASNKKKIQQQNGVGTASTTSATPTAVPGLTLVIPEARSLAGLKKKDTTTTHTLRAGGIPSQREKFITKLSKLDITH